MFALLHSSDILFLDAPQAQMESCFSSVIRSKPMTSCSAFNLDNKYPPATPTPQIAIFIWSLLWCGLINRISSFRLAIFNLKFLNTYTIPVFAIRTDLFGWCTITATCARTRYHTNLLFFFYIPLSFFLTDVLSLKSYGFIQIRHHTIYY